MEYRKIVFFSIMLGCSAFVVKNASAQFSVNDKTRQILQKRVQTVLQQKFLTTQNNLPSQKQLGMGSVPVLDQGDSYDEPVFASTAAIDAAMSVGDLISQECLIKLGNYMAKNSDSSAVLSQQLSRLENYGFVLKKKQIEAGCLDPNKSSLNYEEYHQFSKDLNKASIYWAPILDLNQSIYYERIDTEKTLKEIQNILTQGQRVTMSFLVPQLDNDARQGNSTYRTEMDTWVLTPQILRNLSDSNLYFHSMIITGYDNEAVILDEKGEQHQGLLTLRSSWGVNTGDQGNFYMSYDYFRVLIMEAQQIIA